MNSASERQEPMLIREKGEFVYRYRGTSPNEKAPSPFWYFEFSVDKKPYHGSTRTKDKREAERLARKYRHEILANNHVAVSDASLQQQKKDITFEAAADRYWEQ